MHQVMELGVNAGEGGELSALSEVELEMHAFVMRVAGSGFCRPEVEAKGNLALLVRAVEDLLWRAAKWQTSLREMYALVLDRRLQEVHSSDEDHIGYSDGASALGGTAHGGSGQRGPCRAPPAPSPRFEQRGAGATEPSMCLCHCCCFEPRLTLRASP